MSAEQSTTAVAVHSKSRLPMNNMADFGTASELLAKAGYLGTKNAGEAFMVLSSAHQRGEDLVEFQQKFHLRQGRFSMTAHAMLAEFENRGGTFSDVIRTADKASITLKTDGNEYISSLTWEDAMAEPFVYAGGEKEQLAQLDRKPAQRKLKTKYKTPRSRMQMLWSRVISDGVATLDPGARLAYTPDEVEDFTEVPAEEVVVDPAEAEKKVTKPRKPRKGTQKASEAKKAPKGTNEPPAAAPAPTSPASDAVPFPTEGSEDAEVEMIDYTVMPCGEKAGMKWSKMPVKWLESGLASNDVRITDMHKAEIELALANKKAQA